MSDGHSGHLLHRSDSSYFTGTVALLNSLRLKGHLDDLVVLDNGLTGSQRTGLERHAMVVDRPEAGHESAFALKPFPFLCNPSGIVVVIDSDMIVSASLAPALAQAEAGQICLVEEEAGCEDRWFAEWEDIFGLRAPLRHQIYCNSELVIFSVEHWPWLLERWWTACLQVPPHLILTTYDNSVRFPDQDAINAILMSEVSAGSVSTLPASLEIYASDTLRGVEIAGGQNLACLKDGTPVWILHHDQRPKVWQALGRPRMRPGDPFVRFLPRVLLGNDVDFRLEACDVPWWLRRQGTSIRVALWVVRAVDRLRRDWRRARRLLAGIRTIGAKAMAKEVMKESKAR